MAKNKDITYNQLSTIKPVTDSQKLVFESWKKGMNQFLFLGDKIKMKEAAFTDQSDAWTILLLTGDKAADVMDRLCPADTRSLINGDVIRSMIGHMSAIVEKTGSGFQLMVFRAFAETVLHEVCNSMRSVTAQEKLKKIG